MKKFFIVFLLLGPFFALNARLLDKTLAVINNQLITLSEIERIKKTIAARRNIIPQIYAQTNPSNRDIIEIKIRRIIIREKLNKIGHIVTDEEIEKTIKEREKSLGINRNALINFLKNNNLSFEEYFEITREAIELGRFNNWIIQPLISITEQEIKNIFYKENIDNKTLSFEYSLVDFSLDKSHFKNDMLKQFRSTLKKFQISGILPSEFSKMTTNNLGSIYEDGLEKRLRELLKHTQEGDFTEPYLTNGRYHVFYLKKKDLVESELFQREKNRIKAQLFAKEVQKTSALWFKTEKNKFYIKYFF